MSIDEETPKEYRVLIGANTSNWDGRPIRVLSPKNGMLLVYLLHEKGIAELNCHDRHYGSWFAGNLLIADSAVYVATAVDPAFLLLPILDHAQASIGDVFQAWQQIAEGSWTSREKAASDLLKQALPCLCTCKQVGEEHYYRLDSQKVLAWLKCKVGKTVAGLRFLGETYTSMNEDDLKAYAVGILSEYLSPSWCCKLRAAYGIPEPEPQKLSQPLTEENYNRTSSQGNRPAKTLKLDPKAIARAKAREAAAEKKAQQIKRETAGMKTMCKFFSKTKTKSSQNSENTG